jgi:sugar lactone lactonase YvrE|tara:strand:- start:6563 stop:7453 length:891 start_codon:yes stop_codon:yes gene_type:complete
MEMKVFSHEQCELGEGPLWSPERCSLFWVDISRHLVFEKRLASEATRYDNCWEIKHTPTALALVQHSAKHLWVITASGLIKLELATGKQTIAVEYQLPSGMRTNDANVGPDGKLWISTMERAPSSPAGSIFSINIKGELTPQAKHITIPNTLCWSPDNAYCYLTDSYKRILYRAPFPDQLDSFSQFPWQKSDCSNTTYDGGAVDQQGHLWIARWGGSRIDEIDSAGNTRNQYLVPALQPSSCCFGGKDYRLLFVTTALEGLSNQEKQAAPDAGKVFVMTGKAKGEEIPSFNLDQFI